MKKTIEGEVLLLSASSRGKYTRDMCTALKQMGVDGKTIHHFMVRYNISKTAFYDWVKKYPEFKSAYEFHESAYEAYWVDRAVEGTFGNVECKEKLLMKMFDYATRKSVETKKENSINITNVSLPSEQNNKSLLSAEQLQQEINRLIERLPRPALQGPLVEETESE